MLNDFGYVDNAIANIREVVAKQGDNISRAASMMADAIAEDKLINVYAGGGHTTLAMGEMFFRAGGLANINPLMETALSVFNQALKYLELERTVNFGASIIKYYDIKEGDLVIIFHNIGINPATIDAALEIKKRGGKIIAVASSYWQDEMPADHFIRHPSGKNLFDLADVCIDDFNPVGDTVVRVPGCDTPIAPVSNVVDFYIA
ncbi:MAG: sugar isomerase domain-containing protein, partial [Lentisphaeria bacterium]|nr:sugar isomerase domain-containing protein [Lentisphaeria bacterium]